MRHTQSEANLQDIVASRLNVSLTKKGKSDAKIIADRIYKLITIDRVISSPLMRAKQTAIPIAKNFGLQLEIQVHFVCTIYVLPIYGVRVKFNSTIFDENFIQIKLKPLLAFIDRNVRYCLMR